MLTMKSTVTNLAIAFVSLRCIVLADALHDGTGSIGTDTCYSTGSGVGTGSSGFPTSINQTCLQTITAVVTATATAISTTSTFTVASDAHSYNADDFEPDPCFVKTMVGT